MSICCIRRTPQLILVLYLLTVPAGALVCLSDGGSICRRTSVSSFFGNVFVFLATCASPALANENSVDPISSPNEAIFASSAYGREEYTNSIVASRDTNISPAEAYDVIRQHIPLSSDTRWGSRSARAADIGAGAGLSTTILYAEKGYHSIAAVDWSRTAWDASVVEEHGAKRSVQFYEMDDDTFFSSMPTEDIKDDRSFDVIVYNFAVNKEKAIRTARSFLSPNGLLLAPCNDRRDYWYKQSYILFDQTGTAIWTSGANLDAWSIQFQPDVTSPDCTGIWCGSFNGFFDKQKQNI